MPDQLAPSPLGAGTRGAVGLALCVGALAAQWLDIPVVSAAFRWDPLRWVVLFLGCLALWSAAGQFGGESRIVVGMRRLAGHPWLAPVRRAFDWNSSSGAVEAEGVGAWRIDAVLLVSIWSVSLFGYLAYLEHANPDLLLSGTDWNVYVLNTIAVLREDWAAYIPDKFALHARLAGWLHREGELSLTLIYISLVSASLRPVLAYLLARLVGGRWTALLVSGMVLALPMSWFYATQSSNYPFFSMLVTASLVAVLWMNAQPSWGSAAVAGLVLGVAAATQEKAVVALGPTVGLALVFQVRQLWRAGRFTAEWGKNIARILLTTGIFLGIQTAVAPPKPYTPLVTLVALQRGEVNRDTPYDWAVVKNPDVNDPAGVRSWLPRYFWDGDLESWLAAGLTPPDSNALRLLVNEEAGKRRWVVSPDTTTPPGSLMIKKNLPRLANRLGPVAEVGLVLFVMGAFGLLAGPRRSQRQSAAMLATVLAVVPPLTGKYSSLYIAYLIPVLATSAVVGTDHLLRRLLPPPFLLAARGAMVLFWFAYANASWTGKAESWRTPRWVFPSPAAMMRDERESYALNLKRVAQWLEAHPIETRIVDCVPGGLVMVLFHRPEILHTEGVPDCRAGAEAAVPGTRIVTSSHPGFMVEQVPGAPELLESGRWQVIYGWDASLEELVGEDHPRWAAGQMAAAAGGDGGEVAPGDTRFSQSAVVVLEALSPSEDPG